MAEPNKELIGETSVRYMDDKIVLFINSDGSWSIGNDTNALVKVKFGEIDSVADSTFGFSAITAKPNPGGGYTLYVRSDTNSSLVAVTLDASGAISRDSIKLLTRDQVHIQEDLLGLDLDNSGGLGDDLEVIEGGIINLYQDSDGNYMFGTSAADAKSISVGGTLLSDSVLPDDWSVMELEATPTGFRIYLETAEGDVCEAEFDSNGALIETSNLDETEVATREEELGVDLDGEEKTVATPGWTGELKDASFKASIEGALTPSGKLSYSSLVSVMNGLIDRHKANNNAPISANEFSDLQKLAARGDNLFISDSGEAAATDYLSYVFKSMVDSSPANAFYTGGQATRTALGNLAPNTSLANFQKLVDKWLLGGDLPTPTAGGDTATGTASKTVATYEKSSGTLFLNGVTPQDVQQGKIGDCYMLASLITVADVKPAALSGMFVSNGTVGGTQTWGVRFYDVDKKAHWVTVNDKLPVRSAGSSELVFGGNADKDLNGEIWVPLVEKAYAQANTLNILPRKEKNGLNAYWAIEGGFADPIASFLGGGKVKAYTYQNWNWSGNPFVDQVVIDRSRPEALKNFETLLTAAFNSGKLVYIDSDIKTLDAYGNTLLTPGHAFSIADGDKVSSTNNTTSVYNPWGVQSLPSPPADVGHLSPFPYTVAQLVGMPEVNFWIYEG